MTDGGEPLGWQCFREVKDGDVDATSVHFLNADGSERSSFHDWEWRRKEGNVTLREEESGFPDLKSQLLVYLDVSCRLAKRIVGIEIAPQGLPETGRPFPGQERHQSFYGVRLPTDTVLKLAAAGHDPIVIGYDRARQALFRLPIDVDAIRRGREARRQAMDSTAEMVRNFATTCQRDRASQDASIIT